MQHFRLSYAVTFNLMALAAWWGFHLGGAAGALGAIWITGVLGLMEVPLSFDNASVRFHIPEWFTGLSGVAFIAMSLWSSMQYKKEQVGRD